jgi:HSP20 family protein
MSHDVKTVPNMETSPEEKMPEKMEEIRMRPSADVYRNEEGVRILLDVPGAAPSDVDIQVHDGVLTIEARSPRTDLEMRVYERSFRVDRRLDVDAITAEMQNGVLTVTLPVHEESKPRKIAVNAS